MWGGRHQLFGEVLLPSSGLKCSFKQYVPWRRYLSTCKSYKHSVGMHCLEFKRIDRIIVIGLWFIFGKYDVTMWNASNRIKTQWEASVNMIFKF